MRQAAHEATVLLYSPGVDPFLEDPAKGADLSGLLLRKGREIRRADCQDVAEMEDQKTLEAFSWYDLERTA